MQIPPNTSKYGYPPTPIGKHPLVSPEMVEFLKKTWDDWEGNGQAFGKATIFDGSLHPTHLRLQLYH